MGSRPGRRWAREEIDRLRADRDYERIAHLSLEVRYGDPVLTAALYTVAFCRQMAVPSIAAVVHRGGGSPIIRQTHKLYTLASLTFEPRRIPRLLGLDPLSAKEKEASFRFWRAVGVAMGLSEIPPTPDAFWAWTRDYERRDWTHTPAGEAVARAIVDDYASRWLPGGLARFGRDLVPDSPERSWTDYYGGAYGAQPQIEAVGYRP